MVESEKKEPYSERTTVYDHFTLTLQQGIADLQGTDPSELTDEQLERLEQFKSLQYFGKRLRAELRKRKPNLPYLMSDEIAGWKKLLASPIYQHPAASFGIFSLMADLKDQEDTYPTVARSIWDDIKGPLVARGLSLSDIAQGSEINPDGLTKFDEGIKSFIPKDELARVARFCIALEEGQPLQEG